jgi:aminopeptidase N
VLPDHFIWPISTNILLGSSAADGLNKTIKVSFSTPDATVPIPSHSACPAFIYANAGDNAYGRFLLDERSAAYLSPANSTERSRVPLVQIHDPFLRSQLLTAFWENVRKANFASSRFATLALIDLDQENDESISRTLGGHLVTAFHAYISPRGAGSLRAIAYGIVRNRMLTAPTLGLRIVSFRTFVAIADNVRPEGDLNDLLSDRLTIPGLTLRPLDRWSMVAKLISSDSPLAQQAFEAQQKADRSDDGLKYAWAVEAGRPSAATKQQYFNAYTLSPKDPTAKPEDWLTQSLRYFNAWNQQQLTEPYLNRALTQLPEIKRDRKIFFLGAWLGAFLGGQASSTALNDVHTWLAQPNIDPDLRRKVLENADELERTVRIRTRFPE